MSPTFSAEAVAVPVQIRPLRAVAPRPRLVRPVDAAAPVLRAACLDDVAEMSALLGRYARQGLLLPRTETQICRNVREFIVAEDELGVAGCGALRLYSPELAEIGALAVQEHWQGAGLGRRIVETLLEQARVLGVRRVFALTLQEGFFHRLGFSTVQVSEFPQKVASDCAACAKRASCIEIAVAIDIA